MTGDLTFADIDPELAADEALNAPDPEPGALTEHDIARRVRLVRHLRGDIDRVTGLFDAERARLDHARERALRDPARRVAELEQLIAVWAERQQAAQREAGTPEHRVARSWVMPDGDIRSRRSSRVEVDGPVEDLPASLVRVRVEADKQALSKLPADGEGRLVDPETGEVLPARRVESVSWRIDTPGGAE